MRIVPPQIKATHEKLRYLVIKLLLVVAGFGLFVYSASLFHSGQNSFGFVDDAYLCLSGALTLFGAFFYLERNRQPAPDTSFIPVVYAKDQGKPTQPHSKQDPPK